MQETVEAGIRSENINPNLRLVAWELTGSCNLLCAHCRGSATSKAHDNELTTTECLQIIDQILAVGSPIIILTGGEPLLRHDVFQIATYAANKGLRVVMGSNGTLITEEIAARLKAIPISRIGISLDFPVAEMQDAFRGQTGAFEAAMTGIKNARRAGIQIQINSTISKLNVNYIDDLISLALKVGAAAFHPFMLVPTGRGKGLESKELLPDEYEKTLNYIYDKQLELGDRIFFKPTDVPHYMRVVKQRQGNEITPADNPMHSLTRGCLAGTGFCFISCEGKVKGCGYLDIEAGDVKKQRFSQIWADSPLFNKLRDLSNIKGKCGICEYKRVCGGCRARAYETTGDYLEAEPYCIYEPVNCKRA